MNDAAVQNHNAGFNHIDPNAAGAMLDPNAFMNNPSSFDPSQFQNPQLQQRLPNGVRMPAFNAPAYQTNPVVPSKRPRPREDSLGTSPRQAPGMLPNSRSQTPQQNPYPGFQQNNVPPQHAPQQTPYSHLQNENANASPSPVMGNQLRPGGVPQRVSTASPHPFSPAAQQFPQASPSQSEHGSRVDTPQGNNPYTQNPGYPQGYNQNFTPPPGRTSAPPQSGMSAPHMPQPHIQQQPQMFPQGQQAGQQPQARPQNTLEQQKMLYQMQLQQRNLMNAQRGNLQPGANAMAKGPMQGPNGQAAGMRPQQPSAQGRPNANADSFMKNLVAFMQQRNLPLDMNPVVGDRQISLIQLYMAVVKFGGYKRVTAQSGWGQVALSLQFNPVQQQAVPHQLKAHYERNLHQFEEAWALNQQRQKAAMMQQNPNMAGPGPQMSPTKPMAPQAAQTQAFLEQQRLMGYQQYPQSTPTPQATPVKQVSQIHHTQPAVTGFSTPQQHQGPVHPMGVQGHGRNSLSRSVDVTPPQNGGLFPIPSPISAGKAGGLVASSAHANAAGPTEPPPSTEVHLSDVLGTKSRQLDSWGGVELSSLGNLGERLAGVRCVDPELPEIGILDIHALTMSLQSGLHSEVRLALDVLTKMSFEPRLQVDLRACEDLVESLIDCAEVQVEMLAESTAEVSDVMLITSYEDVVRGCRSEQEGVQDYPSYNTSDYTLDRAVDKLVCITTILRNFSFYEMNHPALADELVIKFLCVVIRYLGTRNMLLRTNQNTLDFMKDVIVFLSNLAQTIELPGREQALCLLHFLLAFAPCPPPTNIGSDVVTFSSYDPALHRYLPPAVDGLAKLLARDEPNRSHYKTIFASDVASTPPFDLLTRTFALAISGIPDEKQDSKRGNLMTIVESRKPFLMQGMLAAEILANLAPGYETGVAKSWLASDDGFSQNLCRLILSLCLETSAPSHPRAPAIPKGVDDDAILHITMGGVAVLRRLAEKSRDPENPNSNIPLSGLPAKERLLEALRMGHQKVKPVLKQLCAYAGLST
jgi:SWI/SNF chromatin-remodeling complex subunit SWI1